MPIELICYGHSQRILFSSDSSKQLKTMKISWREAGLARYEYRYTKKRFVLVFLTFPPTSMALSLTVCHNQNTRMPMHKQRR